MMTASRSSSRSSSYTTSSSISSGTASEEAPPASTDPVKSKIGRFKRTSGRRGRIWITQEHWEKKKARKGPETEAEKPPENFWLSVGLDDKNDLWIWSRHLIDAFKRVNRVPELNHSLSILRPDAIVEHKPFRTLFENMPNLQREVQKSENPESLLDLKALEALIEECVGSEWNASRMCQSMDDGSVSFDTLWSHFLPGDLVISKDKLGTEWLSVFIKLEFFDPNKPDYNQRRRRIPTTCCNFIHVWNVGWDETRGVFRRVKILIKIKAFEGRRPFISLPVYPVKYKSGDIDTFKQHLRTRGRKWKDLLIGKPSKYRSHDGPALIPKPPRHRSIASKGQVLKMRGRVIRDQRPKMSARKVLMGMDSDSASETDEERWLLPVEDQRSEYSWEEIEPDVEFTQTQAELCQPVLACNDVTSGEEHIVSIDNLSPVNWNEQALESLVLPEREKDLLIGLVKHHASKTANARSDLIQSKGKGLVILLYGPPGTGKTLTAESVAETVGKPLVPLSIGGLIADEGLFEERLRSEFEKVGRWDAILLLDEADVLLEARSFEDVTRNGIVSSFLRHLEYFNGVLFLTTNRMETMDDAFQSRINVAIRFKTLDTTTRADIWESLLKDRYSRKEQFASPDAVSHITRNIKRLAKANLNGRQIRNVLNIAEGLAFTETQESGHVTLKHIEDARKSAVEFEKFFKTGKGKDSSRTTSIWASGRKGKDVANDDSDSESE